MNEILEGLTNSSLYNATFGKCDDEDFCIVNTWSEIHDFLKKAVVTLCGEDVFEKYYGDQDRVSHLRLKTEYSSYHVPNEINDAFIKAGLIDEEEEADLDSILGMDWGFSDEYTTCNCCGNIIRTSPDSYSWTADYVMAHFGIVCGDCIRNEEYEKEEYIAYLTNNPKHANTILDSEDIRKYGFVPLCEAQEQDVCEYDAGLYRANRNDDPETQLKNLSNSYESVIFDITSVGQFETRWQIWVKDAMEYKEAI